MKPKLSKTYQVAITEELHDSFHELPLEIRQQIAHQVRELLRRAIYPRTGTQMIEQTTTVTDHPDNLT